MDNIIQLSSDFSDCPKYWQNFVLTLSRGCPDWQVSVNRKITAKLCELGADYVGAITETPSIVFNTANDKLLFIMRYG